MPGLPQRYLVNLILLLLLCQTIAFAKANFTITLNTIADLHLSRQTTVTDLYIAFGKENVRMYLTQPEGRPAPSVAIYIDGNLSMEGFIQNMDASAKLLHGLLVSDKRFITDRGIRVGSTVGELKQQYEIDEVYSGEAGVKFAICRTAQLSFRLKEPHVGSVKAGSISEVPDSIVIDGIYVWPNEKI